MAPARRNIERQEASNHEPVAVLPLQMTLSNQGQDLSQSATCEPGFFATALLYDDRAPYAGKLHLGAIPGIEPGPYDDPLPGDDVEDPGFDPEGDPDPDVEPDPDPELPSGPGFPGLDPGFPGSPSPDISPLTT